MRLSGCNTVPVQPAVSSIGIRPRMPRMVPTRLEETKGTAGMAITTHERFLGDCVARFGVQLSQRGKLQDTHISRCKDNC